MSSSRFNALSQALDIAGSLTALSNLVSADEASGLGSILAGQTGSAASLTTVTTGVQTVTGLTGMTANSVGDFLTITGAASGANNGTFLIVAFTSATSVGIANASAVATDANNPAISWSERLPYSLEDDLNYARTDRAAIKGVVYSAGIPTYVRPSAIGTNVATNLTNIAGKTTDAKALTITRVLYAQTVASTNTKITLTSAGNLKHAGAVDNTGVPCFDVAPFTGDFTSCYVDITDVATGAQIEVQAGGHKGERIFGVTNNGASTSPNTVEVVFYSVPVGGNPSTASTVYTWEATTPTSINCFYGYNSRFDQLDQNALRTTSALGLVVDAAVEQSIRNIESVIGEADSATSLTTLLTNLTGNYSFQALSATPTVVAALNILNLNIGDRTYTGATLTSGQTIVASLQALSNAIATTTITRTIERLAADATANTSHILPGGISYVLDGTNNGKRLFVYWNGILRDPGTVATGDDYTETDTTHITPYYKIKASSHINYFVH